MAAGQRVVLVSGWTGAGKSTIAAAIAADLHCAVASFDWLMSGLRAFPDVWDVVELPVEKQRAIGWSLMSRVGEQSLRTGGSVVFDLVARETPREAWQSLARRYGATFSVVECICSDIDVHRSRVVGRRRDIPGWYELDWAHVAAGRDRYVALRDPKLVIDAINPLPDNLAAVRSYLAGE